jgi:hypothetical protein
VPLTDILLTEVNFQDTLREIDIVLRADRAMLKCRKSRHPSLQNGVGPPASSAALG